MAEKWLSVYDGADLYKAIPKLVKAYNNTEHSTTGTTPEKAFGSFNESMIPYNKVKENNLSKQNIQIGDKVRIHVRDIQNPRNKIRPNWSKEIYTVKAYNSEKKSYRLDDGKLYREFRLFKIENPDKVRKRKINMQISPRVPAES